MKMNIKEKVVNHISVLSKESITRYGMLLKELYRSYVGTSSSVKVQLLLGVAALVMSVLIALLRNLIS